MIRAVLIGVSGYGEFYLSQLLRLSKEGKVQLLGAVVRSLTAGSQAQEHVPSQVEQVEGVGGKVFLTPDEMYDALGRDIDLCCIPTGLSSHAALTMQALEHGCHVLVEKPAAVTVQDIDAMRKLAQKADKDRKSTRLNSSHVVISYAVFCLKKKKKLTTILST